MSFAAAAPIIGSVAGGLLSKGGGSSTQVQKADPWEGVQPALRTLYDAALQNFQGGGQQYYPGQTVAPQSGVTNLAQQGLFSRAMQGNQLLPEGQDAASRTLSDQYMWGNPSMLMQLGIGSGSMLNANPYIDDMFSQGADRISDVFSKQVMPGIASQFSGAGRYGSNQMAEGIEAGTQGFGDAMSKLFADTYGQNYAMERGLQQQALSDAGTQFGRERVMQSQAAGQAPGLSQADYFDIAQLMGLGGQQDAYSQGLLNADISRWDFNQQQPAVNLQLLASLLGGAPMGQTTSTSQPGNPMQGALGGALLGNQLGGLFGGGSIYSPGGLASSGFGSGAAFGNQDLGLFL